MRGPERFLAISQPRAPIHAEIAFSKPFKLIFIAFSSQFERREFLREWPGSFSISVSRTLFRMDDSLMRGESNCRWQSREVEMIWTRSFRGDSEDLELQRGARSVKRRSMSAYEAAHLAFNRLGVVVVVMSPFERLVGRGGRNTEHERQGCRSWVICGQRTVNRSTNAQCMYRSEKALKPLSSSTPRRPRSVSPTSQRRNTPMQPRTAPHKRQRRSVAKHRASKRKRR